MGLGVCWRTRLPMYDVLRPWLFRLDPERAHALGFAAARLAQAGAPGRMRRHYVYEDAVLQQRVAGLDFGNPVGLAAGFDKNAQLLPFWETLGFGFVEVGSVTAHASRGNPRPRTFRLPEDQAIINRMGLPNQGAARISRRIKRVRKRCQIPIGISLAKTHNAAIVGPEAVADYCESFIRLAPMADYVALNVSCPNTADGRTFEDPASLDTLLEAIFRERRRLYSQPPIFLKVSPPPSARVVFDSQIEEILAVGRGLWSPWLYRDKYGCGPRWFADSPGRPRLDRRRRRKWSAAQAAHHAAGAVSVSPPRPPDSCHRSGWR